jgi:transposase
MHRLQELVRLYRLGTGVRERARLLAMSTRTERAYRAALAAADLLEGPPDAVPELAVLRAAVEVAKPLPPTRDVSSSVDEWLDEIHRQAKAGAGPQAIWDRLHRTKPEFAAGVSAVKRAVRRWLREQPVKPEDVAIPVVTAPGEVAQVDFGFAGWMFDPDSGKVRKAWVFVMVMAFSRHMFAKLVFDQKTSTWIQWHIEAFDWFGGVPETIVPDNLKAAVVRAAFGVGDRHELALNRSYRELAKYYGFKVDPTPVASPKKKGHAACRLNHTVRYERLGRLLFATGLAHADGSYTRLLDQLRRVDLLILDDFLRDALTPAQTRDLADILDDRYGRQATLVAAQVPVEEWHARLGDPTLADAILDRLVHNAYRLQLKGESQRKTRASLAMSITSI